MERITKRTTEKKEVVDITADVSAVLEKLRAKDGVCHLLLLHTTAALALAELEPGTEHDLLAALESMIPDLKYKHSHDPAHVGSHILSALVGPALTVPVGGGQLVLGTWQRVALAEFDGPRDRTVAVTFTKQDG